jgi:hypothetical protein
MLYIAKFPPPPPARLKLPERLVLNEFLDPWRPHALAVELLRLPEGMAGWYRLVAPADAAPGALHQLFTESSQSGLLVPLGTEAGQDLAEQLGFNEFASPHAVGLLYDPAVLSDVAWCVLARANRDVLITWFALLAVACEELCESPTWMADMIRSMRAPQPIEAALLAASRAGRVVLYPRALQWIVRELAAADEMELSIRRRRCFTGPSAANDLARSLFPSLTKEGPPFGGEALLAAWVLHEAFQRFEEISDDVASSLAVIGFGNRPRWAWVRHLERWRAIWEVEDGHPSVSQAARPPSEVRALFAEAVGVPPAKWLAGVWLICIRWNLAFMGATALPHTLEDAFVTVVDGELVRLSSAFRAAFRSHVAATVQELGAAARAEAGDSYAGLGSLPQWDSIAVRNRPVVVGSDGMAVPLSLTLLAERAASLHRFVMKERLGGARNVNHTPGRMYEAYVLDVLRRLEPRHTVLGEAELVAAVGRGPVCDAVVGWHGHYVCVEASLQTLRREVATGDLGWIDAHCERYNAKADQAHAVAARLGDAAKALRLRQPESVSVLLVVDDRLAHSAVLANRLRRGRPGRNPRFVCTTQELENLVSFGEAGLSVPHIVGEWQRRQAEVPLSSVLVEMEGLVRCPDRFDDEKWDAWTGLLPREPLDEAATADLMRLLVEARGPILEFAAKAPRPPSGVHPSDWRLPEP